MGGLQVDDKQERCVFRTEQNDKKNMIIVSYWLQQHDAISIEQPALCIVYANFMTFDHMHRDT